MPKIIVVVSSRIFFTKIRYQMGAGLKPDGTEVVMDPHRNAVTDLSKFDRSGDI